MDLVQSLAKASAWGWLPSGCRCSDSPWGPHETQLAASTPLPDGTGRPWPFLPLSSMDLLPKSKYSHLRNESVSSLEEAVGGVGVPASPVESLTGMQSLPGSLSSSSLGPAAPLGELSPESEDSPTTLCSFFPKMANLKLSNPANLLSLRGSSTGGSPGESSPAGMLEPAPGGAAGPNSAGPVAVCSQDMNKLSCGKKTRVEGGQLGGDEWTRHGSFVNKPTRGWLHPDDKVMGPGVSYHVRVSAGNWGGMGRVMMGI